MRSWELLVSAAAVVLIVVMSLFLRTPPRSPGKEAGCEATYGSLRIKVVEAYEGDVVLFAGEGMCRAYLAPRGMKFVAYRLEVGNSAPLAKRLYEVRLMANGREYHVADLAALRPVEVGDREPLLRKYGQPPLLAPGVMFSPLVEVKGRGKGLYWALFLIPREARPEALKIEVPVGKKPIINFGRYLKKG